MAIKALRKLQVGLESTKGTAVAASARMRMTGSLKDNRELVFPDEDIGSVPGNIRSYVAKYLAELSMEGEATFEQLPVILSAAVEDDVSGAQDGSGPYVYDYVGPTTAVNGFKTYTIEYGDDQQEEESAYCFVDNFELSGAAGEAVKVTSKWFGRTAEPSTFTDLSASLPSVEEILVSMGKLYIDAGGGTIGTTQKTNTLLGFSLKWKTGLQPVWTGDGALYYSFGKMVRPEVELSLTFEHDATSVAEKAAWRAQTTRLIRLQIDGSAIAGGSDYTGKALRIDLAGRWKFFDKIDEQNGNDIVTGTFIPRHSSADSLFANLYVANGLATIPSNT